MDNPVIDEHGTIWRNANDDRHRDNGPALERNDGYKAWFQHGYLHRDDGPAVEFADGDKAWWHHGNRHRTAGPAIESADGYKSWYLHGKKLSFDEWLNKVGMSDEAKVMMKLKYG